LHPLTQTKNKEQKMKETIKKEVKKENRNVSFQVNYFDSDKRAELKNWAAKNKISIKLLIYSLLGKKDQIQKLIKEDLASGN
jgi:hypothetical protein